MLKECPSKRPTNFEQLDFGAEMLRDDDASFSYNGPTDRDRDRDRGQAVHHTLQNHYQVVHYSAAVLYSSRVQESPMVSLSTT